jgi:hypothetical protein
MSIQRPTIGNQGGFVTRSYVQEPPSYPVGTQLPSPYPGLGSDSYSPPTYAANYALQPIQAAAPASSGGGLGKLASFFGGGGAAGSGSGGGSINIAQIKQMIDRLGGVEGIVETMGKVQKMVQGVQQMAPLVKVLMGSFGKKKKSRDKSTDGLAPVRRRRRRSRNANGTSGTGKSRRKRRITR